MAIEKRIETKPHPSAERKNENSEFRDFARNSPIFKHPPPAIYHFNFTPPGARMGFSFNGNLAEFDGKR